MYIPRRYSCANRYKGLPQASAAQLKRRGSVTKQLL